MRLYGLPLEQVTAIIHRQSVIHSLVEFVDGAVMAQLGVPDMRIPIGLAMTYPARLHNPAPALDLLACGNLNFAEIDEAAFPCFALAKQAARIGGTACAAMNAANEAAVARYLRDEIGFYDIPAAVERALTLPVMQNPTLDDIRPSTQKPGELQLHWRADAPSARIAHRRKKAPFIGAGDPAWAIRASALSSCPKSCIGGQPLFIEGASFRVYRLNPLTGKGDFMYILIAILMFGVLIFVHELGHFLTAKALDVQVNEFSICMGPALWKKQRGETLYAVRCIPHRRLLRDGGRGRGVGQSARFHGKALVKRTIILVAGSVMNFLTGLLVLAILYSSVAGFSTAKITGFFDGCPLQSEQGLQVDDELYKIDGRRVFIYSDVGTLLARNKTGNFDLVVKRDGQLVELNDFEMTPQLYTVDGVEQYKYGLYFGAEEKTFATVVKNTWYTALDFGRLVWMGLEDLISGMVSVKEMSGPVGIVSVIAETGGERPSASGRD